MKNNNDKIWDAANDDLLDLSCSLAQIKATAISTYSYVDHLNVEPSERTNNVLYMLDVIESLTNTADKMLSDVIDKLCAIYREWGAAK